MFGTIVWVIIAVLLGVFIFRVGFMMLRSLGTPLPPPPPTGEMRKVKIQYRCSICGTEVRMTLATDELPDPPRHCQEDMELVAPIE
jgi:DNA-directed RNA polymerase subunit RPC12/RpoP